MLIQKVHESLSGLQKSAEAPPEPLVPAVSIRSSVKPDYIVCLEDGKKLKMPRRHLMTHYGMTPDDYRATWGDRKSTRLNTSHYCAYRMPSYASKKNHSISHTIKRAITIIFRLLIKQVNNR